MILLIAFLIFALVIGSNWWFGAWNCFLNLMNFFLAALVASSFYENLANSGLFDSTFAYISNFISVWLIFVGTFVFLRLATDLLSRYQLKLEPWVDYVGRGVFSFWLACGFLCFTFFTLHMAPLPPDSFQTDPTAKTLGVGPDRLWLAFIQSRSRGALAEPKQSLLFPEYSLADHPDDAGANARVFDPAAMFIYNNYVQRNTISKNQYLRTAD
ncbi:MAG: CvpA family protein [Proteobacteria bacterium]|nr:CvpA family protein [Pseudomonadota bacterium]